MSGPEPDDVGSVAEEAAKLLGALGEWARDQGGDLGAGVTGLAGHAAHAAQAASRAAEQAAEELDTGAPECRWCPVCRTVHLARQVSPEVRDQLGVAAAALLQAGAGLLTSLTEASQRDGQRDGRSPRPGVERIDLDPPGQDPRTAPPQEDER